MKFLQNIAIALDTTILLLTPGSNKDSDHQKNGGTTTIPDKLIAMQKTPTFDQIDKPRGEEWRITNRCGLESFLVALSGHYNFYALTTWPEKVKEGVLSFLMGFCRKLRLYLKKRTLVAISQDHSENKRKFLYPGQRKKKAAS